MSIRLRFLNRYRRKVKKLVFDGMAYLDEKKPGWRAEINISTLNMKSGSTDILGQLYGSFPSGMCELDLFEGDCRRLALDAPHGLFVDEFRRYYVLTTTWRYLLELSEDQLNYRIGGELG